MVTLTQCFSALVASGNGSRCNGLKNDLQAVLLDTDDSGQIKSYVWKFGKEQFPNKQKELKGVVAEIMNDFIHDVDIFYFGEDIK